MHVRTRRAAHRRLPRRSTHRRSYTPQRRQVAWLRKLQRHIRRHPLLQQNSNTVETQVRMKALHHQIRRLVQSRLTVQL